MTFEKPPLLFVDNSGAVELSRDRKSCHRSRHVDRRYFKVRELQALGETPDPYVYKEKFDTVKVRREQLTREILLHAPVRATAYSAIVAMEDDDER